MLELSIHGAEGKRLLDQTDPPPLFFFFLTRQ